MTLRSSAKRNTSLAAAATLLAAAAVLAQAPAKPIVPSSTAPDHSTAYYHAGLAHMYEDMAINNGRPDYAAQAVEEYKLALNADPTSRYLQDGLADLYFRIGRIREAVTTAQEQVKKDPSDLAAHVLLGKVYLRSLNDMQGPQATEMLQLAICEYEKIVKLQPNDLESHLILGQLYGLNHDSAKAEDQFNQARKTDANSEEAVLSIARLYAEQGEPQRAVDILASVPADDRSARLDFALGSAYDEVHKPKEAAAAYRASVEEDPDNPDAQKALGTALLADDQLDEALKVFQGIVAADPTDATDLVHVSEIQRRQGHYDQALATLQKAKALNPNSDSLDLAFNEIVLYDALGKYDQAVEALQVVLASTAHADGKYSGPERSNRAVFLERLGTVYREENKTPEAIAAYKQIVALGGEYVSRGYQDEIDAYRDAHQWKDALAVAAAAAAASPKDKSVQLAYAMQLVDNGQVDKGLALANAQLTPDPKDSANRDTYYYTAVIDSRLHRSPDALANLQKAEDLSVKAEEKANIYLMRAQIFDHDKRYPEAELEYRKILTIDPNNATVLNDLGYMLADRGVELPDALAMIQKAVTLDPQNGAFLDSLGWAQYRLGQYGPAEDNLKKAIDRQPSDPSIHDHLGEVYEKTGHLQQAVSQWERSMTEYAESLPADADPVDIAKVKHKLEQARTKLASNKTSTTTKKSY